MVKLLNIDKSLLESKQNTNEIFVIILDYEHCSKI